MNPFAQLIEPEVRELVRTGQYRELRDALHALPHVDVADILAELEPRDAAVAFRFLHRDLAGEVFSYLDSDIQETLIHELGTADAVRVVEWMDPDDRAALLDELPAEVAQRIIASLDPEDRRATQVILGYPEESVGRLMTPDYVRVRADWTIAEALDHIRRWGRDAETINVVYVIDRDGRLIDDLRLRTLLLAEPAQSVESVMDRNFIALSAAADQEEAVRTMARYDRIALPVVDSQGVLLGIVTHDDVADVAEAEATEDIQKIGGMEALDDTYMRTTLPEMYKKRGFWLSALFVGQSITIIVLGAFQDQIAKAAVLAMFLPLVISCGGNSGSQAAALITRALALNEVRPSDWLRIVRRELATALLLGGTLAAMGVLCVEIFARFGQARTEHALHLGLTVGVAVLAVVLWGTVAGSLLPLLLRRLGLDPASASSPLVATLMDASGTLIYFLVATVVLAGRLL